MSCKAIIRDGKVIGIACRRSEKEKDPNPRCGCGRPGLKYKGCETPMCPSCYRRWARGA